MFDSVKSTEFEKKFKRYCEYEGQQESIQKSRSKFQANEHFQSQTILVPTSRVIRSFSLYDPRRLAFQNVGQNFQNIPRLGQRNVHSRENIQLINKKMKQIKQVMVQHANLKLHGKSNDLKNQMKLLGNAKTISDIKSESKLAQRNNSDLGNRHVKSIPKLKSLHDFQQFRTTAKIVKNQSVKQMRQTRKHNPQQKQTLQTFKPKFQPQIFRSTLKKKFLDDNPKILANIIRRKAENMNTMQVQTFIKNLISRTRN